VSLNIQEANSICLPPSLYLHTSTLVLPFPSLSVIASLAVSFFEWIRRDEHSVALTYYRSIYISIQCQHTRPNSSPSAFPDIVVPIFDHFTRKICSLLSGIKACLIFKGTPTTGPITLATAHPKAEATA
jgi:hypothetical protein